MKNSLNKLAAYTSLLAAGLLLAANLAQATNYAGNTDTGFGGAVGNGVLSVTDDHTNITVNLQRGSSGTLGNSSDVNLLVIYIDTGTGTATNTAGFADNNGDEQRAISGFDGGGNRSLLMFTNGFKPSYAIAIKKDYMDVWNLANPTGFSYLEGAGQGGYGSANFSLTFKCSDLGLATNVPATIKIFGTYISRTGYRSTEAIAGSDVSTNFGSPQGYVPFVQTAFANYIFAAPVAPTNPVTFSVDMTAQVASSAFVPGTDQVYVGGSFESTPFAFNLHLTNNPAAANTNIYSGTYPDQNLTNVVETYKFKFYSVANGDSYDADPNRTFTLHGGGQSVPLIYFNNTPASPSATTNYITFRIDMGPKIYLTQFNTNAGDQIEVSGSFQSSPWSAGIILTNDPAGTNIYAGTIADNNYPGTQYLSSSTTGYKFVIVNGGTSTYESGANRSLVTPTNSGTLPLAYFNNVSTYAAIPITFSVDMTVPIVTGMFNPGNGDTAGCAGSFMTNQWTVGNVNSFLLTNNPTGANPNIYRGTYIDRNAPGSTEHYKFVINTNGGDTAYESPASTGGGDRIFQLGSLAATNPLVFWNDVNTNTVLLTDTTVTFTVDMANAVDINSVAWDSGNDAVFINGDFATPAWNNYPNLEKPVFWTDPFITAADHYAAFTLTNNPVGSTLYTAEFVVPAGHSYYISYKYGIDHNSGSINNTSIDNEAPSGNDHHRYVRAAGTYNFPVDTFGIQSANAALGVEPLVGNVTIGTPSGNHFPISWLGMSGIYLQTSTNLVNGSWVNITNTSGLSATNWPTGSGSRFFRLIKP